MPRGRPRKQQVGLFTKSAEFLGWALGGLEREIAETRNRLASLTAQAAQLRGKVGAGGARAAQTAANAIEAVLPAARRGRAAKGARKRRQWSAEARKRQAEMMTKRWAERRKAKAKAKK